jgi:hypothetical protein
MRALRVLSLLAVFLVSSLVCPAQDQSSLSGNWHLTGSWNSTTETRLTLSLGVKGDTAIGEGDLQFHCPSGWGIGVTFSVRGQIASDGNFLLTDSDDPEAAQEFSISGKVPEPGSGQWAGSFRYLRETRRCPAGVSGDFLATPLPPLKGIYSGTLLLPDRSSVAVTVDINQGELVTFESEPGQVRGAVALNGTMTVNGSIYPSEALTADASRDSSSRMQGDTLLLVFPLENGAQVTLTGTYTDASENKLRVLLSYLGRDAGAIGFLTRNSSTR